jgi:predicted metal-dependent hydrolase
VTRAPGGRSIERLENQRALELLRRHARRLSAAFELPIRVLHAEGPRVRRRYGICYADGTIKIRLRSVRNGELLRESSLVDTLCHELAHLRHFDHGPGFERLYRRILEYARRHGIYRPGLPSRWGAFEVIAEGLPVVPAPSPALDAPTAPRRAPVQLELF